MACIFKFVPEEYVEWYNEKKPFEYLLHGYHGIRIHLGFPINKDNFPYIKKIGVKVSLFFGLIYIFTTTFLQVISLIIEIPYNLVDSIFVFGYAILAYIVIRIKAKKYDYKNKNDNN